MTEILPHNENLNRSSPKRGRDMRQAIIGVGAALLGCIPVWAASPQPNPTGGGGAASTEPFSGSVAIQQGAGQGEATLLSASEIGRWVANNRARLSGSVSPGDSVVVFTGISAPDFSDWIQLHAQLRILKTRFVLAEERAESAIGAAEHVQPPPVKPPKNARHLTALTAEPPALSAGLAAVGAVQQAIVGVFGNDYSIGGLSVNESDYVLALDLASAIRPAVRTVSIATHLETDKAAAGLMTCNNDDVTGTPDTNLNKDTCFGELDLLAAKAQLQLAEIAGLPKKPPENPTPDQSSVAARLASASGDLTSTLSSYQALLSSLTTTAKGGDDGGAARSGDDGQTDDAKPPKNTAAGDTSGGANRQTQNKAQSPPSGQISIAKAVQEKAIIEALGESSKAVFVKIHASTGGYYVRRNLWTTLGLAGVPVKVSGGAVISWAMTDRRGNLLDGAVATPDSKYESLEDVSGDVDRY